MVVDRAIRASSPVLRIPAWVLAARVDAIVSQVRDGLLDGCLAQLRTVEMRGQHRPSVIRAIDQRSRVVVGGE